MEINKKNKAAYLKPLNRYAALLLEKNY